MTRRIGTVALAAAILSTATAVAAADPQPGAAEFARYCASCHGKSADGRGPVAPVLEPPPADLTRIAARRGGVFPDAEIQRLIDGRDPVVAHGTRAMPIWGETFRKGTGATPIGEMEARSKTRVLLQYLKSIQRPADGEAAPE